VIIALLLGVAALLALSIAAVPLAGTTFGRPVIYGACLGITCVAALVAVAAIGAAPSGVVLPIGLPWLGAHFRLDALAAFFLLVVNLGAAAASLYAIGYTRHEHAPQRVLPFYPAFLGAMNLVVLAADAYSFLLAWEFMSLASWALVVAQHRNPENIRAGFIYIVMASFGTLALLLGFGLLAGAGGGYDFATMRVAHLAPDLAAAVLALTLIGAGSKAGLVPLHVWLPLAHPAAPTHVSALMSGVMTKVAVYAFIRIVFDLLGPPAWWQAVVVLSLGGATAVLGVLYAMLQRDLKRLLAYSTVENVGIIFIGLGLAMAFQANDFAAGAALALTAALFHAFNHMLFKSLLFFGVGAVLNATGERDLDHLGGLIHRMPRTAFLFLVGCGAIAGLPPLNGFVSEWLTFQAILIRPDLPEWGLKIAVPAAGALLALAAALAAACFVRAFGIGFLGRPRSAQAAAAREVDAVSVTAMGIVAAMCLLAGLVPGAIIDLLAPVVRGVTGTGLPAQLRLPWLSIVPNAAAHNSYNGLLIFLFIAAVTWLTVLAIHRFASRALRRAPAWDCGFPDPRPITQYTADSFAQPIRRVFGTVVFGTREVVTMPPPGDISAARIVKTVPDPIWDFLYAPLAGALNWTTQALNHLQFLTIRRYLSLVFVALILLLVAVALWQ
jgi:formate hydrogenlyase subunit 3/multisubunit Na+/H+ antiporter MnhD subunit